MDRKLRTLARVGLLSLALAVGRTARADDDATTAVARERFREGVQYFDQKLFDKARAAFVQAYALKRHPAVLLNLAQSELRSGHEADAATHFAQFLREAKEATDAEKQSADAGLSAAKAVVADVTVNVDEDGALVSVDGEAVGTSPLPGSVYVTPGAHAISAKKEGREVSVQVSATAGQATSANLRFRKPSGAAATQTPAPQRGTNAAPTAPTATGESQVEAESSAALAAPSESARSRQPFLEWATHSPAAIVGGAVTVLGIGGGIGFAIASKKNYDSADSVASQIRQAAIVDMLPDGAKNVCVDAAKQKQSGRADQYVTACSKYQDKVDAGDQFKMLSTISWAVAGVAVVGTVVYYFIDGKEPASTAANGPRKPSATVVPWWSPDARGVTLRAEF